MIILKTPEEIAGIRASGEITARALREVEAYIKPGVSTWQLNAIVHDCICAHGAEPSFLHYGNPPFPASACISINQEVVHGIPSRERILRDGDIVSVDVGSCLNGLHSDACRTFLCGDVDDKVRELVRVTEEAFWLGVQQALPGKRLGDISHAVQAKCEAHGFGVVRELSGHGIGYQLHEAPEILNYGTAGKGLRLQEGMVLCLEPMITLGSYRIKLLDDAWTIVTRDGQPASHYENTFAIWADGPEILTCPERRFL